MSQDGERLEERLLTPSHRRYREACRLWNGLLEPRPAAIVECRSAEDVVTAIRLARSRSLTVSVRGGGHGVAGRACRDGSLVIDLRAMRGVHVDPVRRVARVEGGATWSDLDQATAAHGLASTGGLISSTGVAGLTLGGGIGWLVRRCGLASDNLVAAEIAMADGSLRRVDTKDAGDLFWALRGAGIGFGAVTSLEFGLHPISKVVAGMVMHPAPRAREVATFFRDFTADLPDSLTAILVFTVAPPAPFVPAALHGRPVVAIGACWCEEGGEGDSALAPLHAFGPPAVDTFAPMRYVDAQRMLDPTAPEHQLNYWKSAFLPALTDEVIERLVARGTSLPSPLAQIHVHHLGGAVSRAPSDATAFGQRSAPYLVNVPTMWSDPQRTDAMIAWTRACHAEIAGPVARASYLNFQDRDDRPVDAVGRETRDRLHALKAAVDPDRLFGPAPVG